MRHDDPFLALRDRFPILARSNYLISNSLGAMPAAARAALERFADEWQTRGVRAWGDGWWSLQERVAGEVAAVLGVPANAVAMHQNVASALESILSCFRFDGRRAKVVLSDLSFPSDRYIYEARRRFGARVVSVPGTSDGLAVDIDRLVEAIDDETLLVGVDHVLFRSAALVDVGPIVERARQVGAFVVLDVFHSVGVLPLALHELGVHAAVGGALKWLCGGPGNGFLYVHPDEVGRLEPSFTGWAAHRDPFAFSAAGQDYRADGGRFATGTPNVPALCAGREGIALVREAGSAAIRARSLQLTARIVDEADRAGLPVFSPRAADQRGGHVALAVPEGHAVCQALSAREIVVDYRPDAGLRLAPHFYNTEQEVVAAVRAIREILDRGEHEPYLHQQRRPG